MKLKFKLIETPLKDLYLIEPTVYKDSRGFFMESWNEREFKEIGLDIKFVQDNHSKSVKGVLRGLHFQHPHAQAKLVRVVKGAVFDVAVDLRKSSPTFKRWFGVILSEENHKMLYIPEGFAHGFLALTDEVHFLYKVSDYYCKECDGGIRWDDPDIGIKWPFEQYGIKEPIVSEKDRNLPYLRDIVEKLAW